MRYILSLLFLLAISGKLVGQTETVKNDKREYELTVPKGWKMLDVNGVYRLQAPFREEDGGQTAINFSTAPGQGMNVEELYELYIVNGFSASFEDFKSIETEDLEIDGIKAKSIVCSYKESISLQTRVTLMVRNDVLHIIIGITTPQVYDYYAEAFREIPASMRFLK